MSDPQELTLAEAVPLATVLLQRLLSEAGIRSLAIKGPAFAELGVRARKTSHDVDLLIHPADRRRAADALLGTGWYELGYDLPPEVSDIVYSTTYGHAMLPSTVDVHHVYPGLLLPPDRAFEALWQARSEVRIAGQPVIAPGTPHALVIDALHRLRSTEEAGWAAAAEQVVRVLRADLSAAEVVAAAGSIGARWTAAPVIAALGGPAPSGRPDPGFEAWRRRCGPYGGDVILGAVLRRAPWRLPSLVWGQLTVPEEMARFWASAHGVEYRSRGQVLGLRMLRLARASSGKLLRRRVRS